MKKEKNNINFDDLSSEVTQEKIKLRTRLKNKSIKMAKNAVLAPIFISTYKNIATLAKSLFPKQGIIETYEEGIVRNNYTDEDIKRGYNYHKNFRTFFLFLASLFFIFMLLSTHTKLSLIAHLISLTIIFLLVLKHDLRVFQIENKKLCFFSEYIKERFLKSIFK